MANATGAPFARPSPSRAISSAALSVFPAFTSIPASRPAVIGFQGARLNPFSAKAKASGSGALVTFKVWIQFQGSSRLHQCFIIFAGCGQRNREANSHDQIEGILFQRAPVLIDRLQGSSYLSEIEIPVPMPQERRHWLPRKSDIEPSLGFFPVKISPDGENAHPGMRFG